MPSGIGRGSASVRTRVTLESVSDVTCVRQGSAARGKRGVRARPFQRRVSRASHALRGGLRTLAAGALLASHTDMHRTSKSRRTLPRALLALAGCAASVLHAQQAIQSLETIRAAAEEHVRTRFGAGDGITVSAGSLDPRLRLAPCAGPLVASSAPAGLRAARVTVGVRCTQGATWTVYVPVSVESEVQVLVLRHAAARGTQLTEADVMVQTRRVPGFGGAYLGDPRQLVGRTLRKALPSGAVLTPDALEADVVIRRGQQVTLLAASGGIQVRASGRALADGRAGERLKVQNERSNVVVEGVVESPGVIRVTP